MSTTMGEAIKDIIQMEKNAVRIYTQIARQAEGEIQAIAARLQQEERQHAHQLEQTDAGLQEIEIPAEVLNMIHLALQEQMTWLEDTLTFRDTKEFFLQALRWEDDSMHLYEDLQQYLKPAAPQNTFFTDLAATERTHMYTILNLLHQTQGE